MNKSIFRWISWWHLQHWHMNSWFIYNSKDPVSILVIQILPPCPISELQAALSIPSRIPSTSSRERNQHQLNLFRLEIRLGNTITLIHYYFHYMSCNLVIILYASLKIILFSREFQMFLVRNSVFPAGTEPWGKSGGIQSPWEAGEGAVLS